MLQQFFLSFTKLYFGLSERDGLILDQSALVPTVAVENKDFGWFDLQFAYVFSYFRANGEHRRYLTL